MKPFLRIEKPCQESLANMHDVPEGKFCDLCSKKVIDFSVLNDSEISKILLENKGEKLCGMVDKNQMNRQLEPEIPISSRPLHHTNSFAKIAAGFVLTASIVNFYPSQTQQKVKTEYSTTQNNSKKKETPEEKKGDGNIFIEGKVTDKKGKPIADVTVKLINIQKIYSVKTDINGHYSLEIPDTVVRNENLLNFIPASDEFISDLLIVKKEEISKQIIIKLPENDFRKEYGEITEVLPYINSLVILEGKKIDTKLFNKSYMLFHNRYEVYYIPKPYTKAFTNNEKIEDIFIAFIK